MKRTKQVGDYEEKPVIPNVAAAAPSTFDPVPATARSVLQKKSARQPELDGLRGLDRKSVV